MASLEIEIIGWIGALMLVYAYFLITDKKVTGRSWSYLLLNLFGGAFLALNSYVNGALPSVVNNVIWVIVAIYGVEKVFTKDMPARLVRRIENIGRKEEITERRRTTRRLPSRR
jgi:hypothetical protein